MPIAQINNQGLYYEDSGGEGPAIVFMHGFMFDQAMFDPQVEALSSEYRCVRFDARGFGQTQWDGEAFTLHDTAADCIGLMDHLGIDKAFLVGHSQGGYATIRVAISYPDRVKGMVFISTYNGVDTEDVKEIYRSMRDTWRDVGPDPVVGTLLTLFLGPEDVAGELWKTWKPKWSAHTPAQMAGTMNNLIDRDEVGPEKVSTITAPALVIHSDGDQGIPLVLGQALHDSLPITEPIVVVSGQPHALNLTAPEAANEPIKAFLAKYA